MSILDKIKKKSPADLDAHKTDAPARGHGDEKSRAEKRGDFRKGRISRDKAGLIVAEPLISEKSSLAAQFGKYIFKVADSANKNEIKKAVEAIYNVNVMNVNILKTASKPRRMGRRIGRKRGFKKAIITLKKGESIDFNK